ncbi:MAG: HIT family protein [Bryobacterales bacterium]
MCVFCKIAAGEIPSEIVFEDDISVAFLDVDPLFPGHVLLVPREHYATLPELPADKVGPFFQNAQKLVTAVQQACDAPGCFVGQNNVVSQSVPHLHVHIVPRRPKDGLRGFFWPKNHYESDEHKSKIADAIRQALAEA